MKGKWMLGNFLGRSSEHGNLHPKPLVDEELEGSHPIRGLAWEEAGRLVPVNIQVH